MIRIQGIATLCVFALVCATLVVPTSAQVITTGDLSSESLDADKDVLVVGHDSDAEFHSIQAAVNNASDGDTVTVRPGTYRERVTIDANVTLVAPDGATLNGSEFDDRPSAFTVREGFVPTIEGFTVRDYAYGVNADRPPEFGSTGPSAWDVGWTVRNVTFVGCSEEAIRAGNSPADWTVENIRIDGDGGYVGIAAFGSSGDWTIRNTVVREISIEGIDANGAAGEWVIRNTSVADPWYGITVGWSNGTGTITDTTVRNVERGIDLSRLSGDVTITNTIVENVTHPPDDPAYRGVAVYAPNTSGDWQIHDSIVRNYTRFGVNATDANPHGDATGNWWGRDGSSDEACLGNVQCGEELSTRPAAGASLDDPGAPEWSEDERSHESPTGNRVTTDRAGTQNTTDETTPKTATTTTETDEPVSPTPSVAETGSDRGSGSGFLSPLTIVGSLVVFAALVGVIVGLSFVVRAE